ncbi:MAG: protease modulator HflC [Pseudomonadales bacterium]|jgi:membrane protease subunit HflC|nr:protease modulator HflC [Pseudomonadales bacterium]MDP6469564.1 protease modulator HflC [Pseudomonadales bacterium]MDP6827405.1 protease modulator HflC [Pseudomonadales bacterium]MDP6971228.1 protease modulator HflC [Pseudomonadales bacterium]|tara:strand:- start:916 stop:1785 length:870 start_codon:yes stop_codon:yes gene_type:complete
MNLRAFILFIIAAAILFVLTNSIYQIKQTERAILLRFGAVSEADVAPGLHFKLPIAEQVHKFDARVIMLDSSPETYFTLEKKPLIVDSFAKWRIQDVQKYYQASTGDERRAMRVLQERVSAGLRNQISRRDMHEVISGERDQLMQELTAALNRRMKEEMGVEVIDVRVKRIDLPTEASSAVYDRMNSEREIEARQYRAQGEELARGIRADAERQTVVIEAEAYRESEQLRGEGDARSASIYAGAFTKDPEFYEFYRSINAYAKVFSNKGDLLILDPNGEFFKYLKSNEG